MEAVGSVDMGCRDESGGTQMDGVRRFKVKDRRFKVKDRINQLIPKIRRAPIRDPSPPNDVEIALIGQRTALNAERPHHTSTMTCVGGFGDGSPCRGASGGKHGCLA